METILGRRENDEGLLTRDEVVNLERILKSGYIDLRSPYSLGNSENRKQGQDSQQFLSREDILKWEALFRRKDGTKVNIVKIYNSFSPREQKIGAGQRKQGGQGGQTLSLNREDVKNLENSLKRRNRRIQENSDQHGFRVRSDIDTLIR